MYAAYKGHHYAGPGNHFCKCIAYYFRNKMSVFGLSVKNMQYQ